MRFGTADDAKTMFDGAVQSHFTYVGAGSAAAYLASDANYNNATTTSQRSNLIGIQKWIAMNGLQESEGWVEARRFDTSTGGNVFTNTTSGIFEEPASSVLPAGVFPSIYLYPQSEKDFNATNVPARVITDKVFWDN